MPTAPTIGTVTALAAATLIAGWLAQRWMREPVLANRLVGRLGVCAFVLLLVAALTPEAWMYGWTWTQGQLLFAFEPWRAAAPPEQAWGNPLLRDATWQGYPWLAHVCRSLRQGEVPLWNPLAFAGHPFAASVMPGVFSPFTAAACLAPLPWASTFAMVLRLVTAGLGSYLWLRALAVSRPAALVGTVAGTLNPFTLVWLENASDSVSASAPWVLWAVTRVARDRDGRGGGGVALATALTLLAGQPETAFNVLLFAGAVGAVLAIDSQRPLRALGTMAAGGAVGVALAAIQLVPFLEYLRESRVLGVRADQPVNASFTPRRLLIGAFVPDFFGHPSGTSLPIGNRYGSMTNYVEQVSYAGVATWVLAAVGLATGRRRGVALAAAGLAGAAVKFGAPGVLDLVSRLPLLRLAPLGRFGLLMILAALALAGLGADALLRTRRSLLEPPRPTTGAAIAAAWAATSIVVGACGTWLTMERTALASAGLWRQTLQASLLACALALATALIVTWRARGRLGAAPFVVLVVTLMAGDLLAFGRAFRPMVPPSQVYPDVPALEIIRKDTGLFRVAGWGGALLPNANVVYGFAQFRGYDGMNPRRYGELLDTALGSEALLWQDRPFQDSPLFDLLNVKYLIARPDAQVPRDHFEQVGGPESPLFRNRRVFPRAFLADSYALVAADRVRVDVVYAGHDLRRRVLLEAPLADSEVPQPAADPGTARVTRYESHLVEVATEADGRRLLVLTDLEFPGWRATVDGRPAHIHRANAAFRAVAVPGGAHRVRFEYVPGSYRLGAAVSGFALLLIVATPTLRRRARS